LLSSEYKKAVLLHKEDLAASHERVRHLEEKLNGSQGKYHYVTLPGNQVLAPSLYQPTR